MVCFAFVCLQTVTEHNWILQSTLLTGNLELHEQSMTDCGAALGWKVHIFCRPRAGIVLFSFEALGKLRLDHRSHWELPPHP